jgi:uncharacterized protein YcaQ
MTRAQVLAADQARRMVVAAQGLAEPRPTGRVDRRHLRRVFDRLGLVQLDSVNVLVRSHYLPFFSRLGPYDRSRLDDLAYRHHEAFEYWGHVASLIRPDLQPALRWRMASEHGYAGMRRWVAENAELIERVHGLVIAAGPVSAGDLEGGSTKHGPWWGWGDTKRALEHLFHAGRVGATRRGNFERAYCDPAMVLPAGMPDRPTPSERDAMRVLLEQSARGHGVGTATDLADYFRLPIRQVRPLLEEMVADGTLEAVEVEGWRQPGYRHPQARLPRRITARALVSPFDSVMWERDRVERVFGFRYRIEIYVPEGQRVHGYYVLPFLLEDRYVARVDLKADRKGSRLLVQSAFIEPGEDQGRVAEALADELRSVAGWLDLDEVVVRHRGDLAPALLTAVS